MNTLILRIWGLPVILNINIKMEGMRTSTTTDIQIAYVDQDKYTENTAPAINWVAFLSTLWHWKADAVMSPSQAQQRDWKLDKECFPIIRIHKLGVKVNVWVCIHMFVCVSQQLLTTCDMEVKPVVKLERIKQWIGDMKSLHILQTQ